MISLTLTSLSLTFFPRFFFFGPKKVTRALSSEERKCLDIVYKNLVLSTELINVNWPPYRDSKS